MHMIKLQLFPPNNTLDYVRRISGLDALTVDESYGLVSISPKRGLYVIRVLGEIDISRIRVLPEVKGVYGDVRVAPVQKGNHNLED